MKLFFMVILTMAIVTPIAMWLFGFSIGIMVGIVSPIFVIPGLIVLAMLLGGRNMWR